MSRSGNNITAVVYKAVGVVIYTLVYSVGLKPLAVDGFGSLAAQMPELAPLLNFIPELFDILSPDPVALFLHILVLFPILLVHFFSK